MATTPTGPSVIFDADMYELGSSSFGGSATRSDWGEQFGSHTASSNRSSHPDNAHARYVPPHQRGRKEETGDEFAFPQTEKHGDEQGVDNRHFGRLICYVMYALTKASIQAIHSRFPGMFFVSKDVVNHDHPIAHVVTQVGTTFLQRMIKSGSKVLDVYGNPASCEAFNRIQERRKNPKHMTPLVNNFGGADYIREINKWGPWLDDQDNARYSVGRICEQTSDWLSTFSIYQMIHTLYYISDREIQYLLGSTPGQKILALVHTHSQKHGYLNEGEQEYWVKGGIVKQWNVNTKTTYYHPDITPKWFSAKKTRVLSDGFEITWECHLVCKDTWIIEIVRSFPPAFKSSAYDWEGMFEAAEKAELGIKAERLAFDEAPPDILPTTDGKFVELNAHNAELVSKLRTQAVGRSRVGKDGAKLMLDLISLAKHLSDPSAVFEGQPGLKVDDGSLADHVVKAFISDVPRELALMGAVDMLSPMLRAHAAKKVGPKIAKGLTPLALMQNFRTVVQGGIVVNKTIRSKDVLGAGLQALDDALDDRVWGS